MNRIAVQDPRLWIHLVNPVNPVPNWPRINADIRGSDHKISRKYLLIRVYLRSSAASCCSLRQITYDQFN